MIQVHHDFIFQMSCFGKCCRGLFLSLLSIITCGVLFAAMIAVVIVEKKKRFDEVWRTGFIISIVICVLCGLLLLFAIYASCCGKRCAKSTLGILFLVFMIILIIFAVCIWALRETILKCCNEPTGWDTCSDVSQKACRSVFSDFFRKFGNIVGAVLVVLAVLLLIGAIVAFSYKKCKEASSGITYKGA